MKYNTIIIGSGAAGMAASLYLKRAGINPLLIDKDAPGGQMLKTSVIENYLGFESISGADLALKMYNQIKNNNIDYKFGEVISIQENNNYIVKTKTEEFECENIIIAVGKTPQTLPLENIDKIKGISYCAVCDGSFYKNKDVAVVGGGDSAFTNAIYLAGICNQVYILVRNKIKAGYELINQAKSFPNIKVLEKTEVKKLNAEDNKLESIILNNDEKLDIKGLFIAIGGRPNLDFIKDINLKDGYIKVDKNMETSKKNIYAAGDIISKDFYQISTAINDGIIAALSIKSRWKSGSN